MNRLTEKDLWLVNLVLDGDPALRRTLRDAINAAEESFAERSKEIRSALKNEAAVFEVSFEAKDESDTKTSKTEKTDEKKAPVLEDGSLAAKVLKYLKDMNGLKMAPRDIRAGLKIGTKASALKDFSTALKTVSTVIPGIKCLYAGRARVYWYEETNGLPKR
jgi:hypothetical protein